MAGSSSDLHSVSQIWLSVLNRFVAATDDFNREDLGSALMHAEGLIRAGNALSKTEGGAA